MKLLLLIKIGGGVITDKSRRYGLREDVAERLAREIKEGLEGGEETKMIIGNGAGSFAHWSAKKYGTHEGFNDDEGAVGAGWVRHDAVKLNQIVVEKLLKEKVPAYSFSPSSMFQVAGGDLVVAFVGSMKDALRNGLVPVVYGDVVIDSEKGSGIYSTERVFEVLVGELLPDYEKIKIIHVSSEDGVMGDGQVISSINSRNYEKFSKYLGESSGVDVTGGMLHKVKESLSLAEKGVETVIINGLIEGRLKRAILGQDVTGTSIT